MSVIQGECEIDKGVQIKAPVTQSVAAPLAVRKPLVPLATEEICKKETETVGLVGAGVALNAENIVCLSIFCLLYSFAPFMYRSVFYYNYS